MSEQNEQRPSELDGWPVPSRDVLRDLERSLVAWPEPEHESELAAA